MTHLEWILYYISEIDCVPPSIYLDGSDNWCFDWDSGPFCVHCLLINGFLIVKSDLSELKNPKIEVNLGLIKILEEVLKINGYENE